MKSFAVAIALTGTLLVDSSWAETPLLLERKISLGEVRGRIDHLAVDLKRNRLFVAELENDTVAVVDLVAYKVIEVISGHASVRTSAVGKAIWMLSMRGKMHTAA